MPETMFPGTYPTDEMEFTIFPAACPTDEMKFTMFLRGRQWVILPETL